MFSFLKKKFSSAKPEAAPAPTAPAAPTVKAAVAAQQPAAPAPAAPLPADKPTAAAGRQGWLDRLKQGLRKTGSSISTVFTGTRIDDELYEELETALLLADTGTQGTQYLLDDLKRRVKAAKATDPSQVKGLLAQAITDLLQPLEKPLAIGGQPDGPTVMMVAGVNGAGKTTTIGKLAKKLQSEGKKVMLAAGDTFRAAAVEQLQVWGERNKIPVIAQHTGADSASVIFDAVQAAKARNIDVLIADTAGRLHTKDNLMEELKKVRRVIGKLDADAPHEVLLVLDAGTGQNAISQAKQFNQTVQLTGLALTKLDGTAKGGVIFALAKQFGLPIRYIGVGEGIDDLRTFEAEPFVQALFAERERS